MSPKVIGSMLFQCYVASKIPFKESIIVHQPYNFIFSDVIYVCVTIFWPSIKPSRKVMKLLSTSKRSCELWVDTCLMHTKIDVIAHHLGIPFMPPLFLEHVAGVVPGLESLLLEI